MRKIRAVLIDPSSKEVRDIEITPRLENFYEVIECETIEAVYPPQFSPDHLYVDEEGSFDPELAAFKIRGYGVIVGKAILLGTNRQGESISPVNKAEDIEWLITF